MYKPSLLISFELPAVPPIILSENYLLNILKVYSEDFICLVDRYRSIFLKNSTILSKDSAFFKLPQFDKEFIFFHVLLR